MRLVLGVMLNDEYDADRESVWESSSKRGRHSALLISNEGKGSQTPPQGGTE